MFNAMAQRSEQLFLSEAGLTEEAIGHLPSYIDAIASIIAELRDVSDLFLLVLERLVIVQLSSFARLYEKMVLIILLVAAICFHYSHSCMFCEYAATQCACGNCQSFCLALSARLDSPLFLVSRRFSGGMLRQRYSLFWHGCLNSACYRNRAF